MDVKNRFRNKFNKMKKMNKIKTLEKDLEETALFAGEFKGHCSFWRKYGHKGAKCKKKISNQQQKSKKDY
jgi:hypothetical protein